MSGRIRRFRYAAIAVAALSIVVAGCASGGGGSSSGGSGNSNPIVIGMSASETGADSVSGKASLEGIQYAVQAANASGGWLGRKLKLVVIDDQSDPTQAQQAYQKLITQDKVDFIIGPYGPDLAAAAGAVATRYQYVMLDPETALPPVPGSKWAILDEPPTQKYMTGYPALAAKLGYHKIAILGINNAYGKICVGAQKAEATKAGLDVVYTTYYAPTDNLNSAAEAIKAKDADVVDQCSFFTDGVALTRALNDAGYRPKMLGITIAPSEPTFISSLGTLAEHVISTTSWAPSLPTQGNAEFVSGFTKTMGHAPDYHSANDYAAVEALGDAVKDANSTDQNAVLKKLYSSTYHTVLGTFKLSPDGAATSYTMYLDQIQSGKLKLIYPPSVDQAKAITPY